MNIEFEHATFSTRRFSSSTVYVNESIRLEYSWFTLNSGDTLTFADGSRYTFYNIYNHRNIDEIPVGNDSLLTYARHNRLDETTKIPGPVSYLMKDTNFDKISHKNVELDDNFDSAMEEEVDPGSPMKMHPFAL